MPNLLERIELLEAQFHHHQEWLESHANTLCSLEEHTGHFEDEVEAPKPKPKRKRKPRPEPVAA